VWICGEDALIDNRFSRDRFEEFGGIGSTTSKELLDVMTVEFLKELTDGVRASVDYLGEQLLGLGYELTPTLEFSETGRSVCFDFRDCEDSLVVAVDINLNIDCREDA
jgi:hypothetical protein